MSLTARDLLQKLAKDAGMQYRDIAKQVNSAMSEGEGLLASVHRIATENDLKSAKYSVDANGNLALTQKILGEDYTQTLMISAVLGQMVEAKGKDRFPAPAFFAFLEILGSIPQAPKDAKSETSIEIEERTTEIIELTTTLVSVICEWSKEGICGVAKDIPEPLNEIAKAVFRKTRLLQGGLWTCISCGSVVNVKEAKALMCATCDAGIRSESILQGRSPQWERERRGYGQSEKGEKIE